MLLVDELGWHFLFSSSSAAELYCWTSEYHTLRPVSSAGPNWCLAIGARKIHLDEPAKFALVTGCCISWCHVRCLGISEVTEIPCSARADRRKTESGLGPAAAESSLKDLVQWPPQLLEAHWPL